MTGLGTGKQGSKMGLKRTRERKRWRWIFRRRIMGAGRDWTIFLG